MVSGICNVCGSPKVAVASLSLRVTELPSSVFIFSYIKSYCPTKEGVHNFPNFPMGFRSQDRWHACLKRKLENRSRFLVAGCKFSFKFFISMWIKAGFILTTLWIQFTKVYYIILYHNEIGKSTELFDFSFPFAIVPFFRYHRIELGSWVCSLFWCSFYAYFYILV